MAYNTTQSRRSTRSEVRKALNMAVNKQAIIDAVYPGRMARPGQVNPIPPTMWSYNKDIKDDQPTILEAVQEGCWPKQASRICQDEDLGDAGVASIQPERPVASRS